MKDTAYWWTFIIAMKMVEYGSHQLPGAVWDILMEISLKLAEEAECDDVKFWSAFDFVSPHGWTHQDALNCDECKREDCPTDYSNVCSSCVVNGECPGHTGAGCIGYAAPGDDVPKGVIDYCAYVFARAKFCETHIEVPLDIDDAKKFVSDHGFKTVVEAYEWLNDDRSHGDDWRAYAARDTYDELCAAARDAAGAGDEE